MRLRFHAFYPYTLRFHQNKNSILCLRKGKQKMRSPFILVLRALHLRFLEIDLGCDPVLCSTPPTVLSWFSFAPLDSSGTHGARKRHTMLTSQYREPNSRDSEKKSWIIRTIFKEGDGDLKTEIFNFTREEYGRLLYGQWSRGRLGLDQRLTERYVLRCKAVESVLQALDFYSHDLAFHLQLLHIHLLPLSRLHG